MPDISGFTKFVQETEAEHSQHIISELLELLIDQNTIDLQLAEIEGDALFYYKFQDVLNKDILLEQARNMYRAFHKHLQEYENNRICNCGACRTAPKLELKFIIHGGDFDFIKVKDFKKPHGTSVIKAHRLLKNNVGSDEYVLISEDLVELWGDQNSAASPQMLWEEWQEQQVELDLGPAPYRYRIISDWKNNLEQVIIKEVEAPEVHILDYTISMNAKPFELFETLSNLKYRNIWNKDITRLEYADNHVNRAGMKHVCVIGDTHLDFETIKPHDDSGDLIYAERTTSIPAFEYVDSYFVLKETAAGTQLNFKMVGKKSSWLTTFIKPFLSMKLKSQLKKQLINLNALVEKK